MIRTFLQTGPASISERRRVVYAFHRRHSCCSPSVEAVRPGFASLDGIRAILVVASFVGLVAAGQTFVILIGGIDLSVPWVLNAGAILMVTSSLGSDARAIPALALTLGMGALVGACNGAGVALLGIPAVVMTLAMNGIMQGLTLGFERRHDLHELRRLRAAHRAGGGAFCACWACRSCSGSGCW